MVVDNAQTRITLFGLCCFLLFSSFVTCFYDLLRPYDLNYSVDDHFIAFSKDVAGLIPFPPRYHHLLDEEEKRISIMPAHTREASRDREVVVRSQSVPMYVHVQFRQ